MLDDQEDGESVNDIGDPEKVTELHSDHEVLAYHEDHIVVHIETEYHDTGDPDIVIGDTDQDTGDADQDTGDADQDTGDGLIHPLGHTSLEFEATSRNRPLQHPILQET